MAEIKSGVVVVTKFCKPYAEEFKEYIDYIDRETAKRNAAINKFNLFNDYMDNPEKTTGLFTRNKDNLDNNEKKELKCLFENAQSNNSLMWQTVISFDNTWLEKQGLYDRKNNILNEDKIKEITRKSINKMFESENLENAVWSGAIHYNTDNIHVHFATVEPVPTRNEKEYIQYKMTKGKKGDVIYELDEKGEKIPLLDENGKVILSTERRGKFKQSSIESCKSILVNEILMQKDTNILINNIIRENIVNHKKEIYLNKDNDLGKHFKDLYNELPDVKRSLWNYNNNILADINPKIDQLSKRYIEKYHPDDFKILNELLDEQNAVYKESYGQNKADKDFKETKLKDMYARLGNAILKEIREYDKSMRSEDKDETIFKPLKAENEYIKNIDEPLYLPENLSSNEIVDENILENVNFKKGTYYCEWNKEYKEAKKALHPGKNKKPDYDKAFKLFTSESLKGNVLAVEELGNMYEKGVGVKQNDSIAEEYYYKGLEMFLSLYNEDNKPYYEYRIGKHYNRGMGVEKDYESAAKWFEKASTNGNPYAQFSLGGLYYYGNGVERNYEKAFSLYKESSLCERGMPFADYELGKMYEKGIGAEIDKDESHYHYEKALESFLKMEKDVPDDKLEYKIGSMYLNGIGCEKDLNKAIVYLELAANSKNVFAQYSLAQIYISQKDVPNIKKAIEWLEESGKDSNKNKMVFLTLGKIYMQEIKDITDYKKAEKWLTKACEEDNEYAYYTIGKLYLKDNEEIRDFKKAEYWLLKACDKDNEYAQYSLGKLYMKDNTEIKDFKKAEYWLLKACDKDNEYAQYSLGKLYMNKESGIYNPGKGINYLGLAAKKDNQYAQLSLGMVYLKGEVVQKDINKAKEWLNKAADQGNEYAKNIINNLDNKNINNIKKNISELKFGKKAAMEFSKAMFALKSSLNKEMQKTMKNIIEHEQMIEEVMQKNDRDI